jgi:2-dehydropantoate 2-reductase
MIDKVIRWSQEIRDIHTSMYDDWKAGRPPEIEALNGYVARRARALGVAAPLNEAMTALIAAITGREKGGDGPQRIDIETRPSRK